MISFDPSAWLLLVIPSWLFGAYVTRRGFVRNEFRRIARNGWFRYDTWSASWIASTFSNLLFLIVLTWALYEATFHGTKFEAQPQLPEPGMSGAPIDVARSKFDPSALAGCIADLNHGQIYAHQAYQVVAVRNGRNSVMYTFAIVAEGTGSRIEVYRSLASPFVSWGQCIK
jgi:hypothetical protein